MPFTQGSCGTLHACGREWGGGVMLGEGISLALRGAVWCLRERRGRWDDASGRDDGL